MARLIGVRTKGLGCGFMYKGSEYTLPHAKLRYRIPNCVRLRADGSNEVAGIRPDLAIPIYERENEADRAARFLDAIARDLPTSDVAAPGEMRGQRQRGAEFLDRVNHAEGPHRPCRVEPLI